MLTRLLLLSFAIGVIYPGGSLSQDESFVSSNSYNANPKAADFPECSSNGYNNAKTKVAIRVGEPNFQYTMCGFTNTARRISIAGDYRDNPTGRYGNANLYAIVDTGIAAYTAYPSANILDLDVQNYQRELFYFRIISPKTISANNHLRMTQLNETTLLVIAPSKSVRL